MKGVIRVVAMPELAAGFQLAGLPTLEAETPEQGAELIQELAAREDVAVVLAEEVALDAVPEASRRELWNRPIPIVVPFSGPTWAEEREGPEAYILEILQRAIGYRVRLR